MQTAQAENYSPQHILQFIYSRILTWIAVPKKKKAPSENLSPLRSAKTKLCFNPSAICHV